MSPVESVPVAVLNSIDDYVELLYDDIPEKIKGSALILQLARNPDNLIELARNEALLSALSRVLREEWKRSIELSTNISEPPKSRIPEPKRRPKSGTWAVADVNIQKSRSLVSSYHEDLCNASDECLSKNDEEQMKRKLKTLSKRQEQLLRVAFYMLLNVADNVKVEEKMHKKDIVGLLIGAMERHSNIDLLILIVSFLQKLSIFVENKNSMASKNIIEKLAPLLESPNADLVNVTLKLLFNLTFDTKMRNKIIKIGLLQKFINFTSDDKHINLAMKILYHLSMDDRVKLMFTQSDCVKLIGSGGAGTTDVLLALCVNLAWCERAAQQMAAEGRLRELLTRAFRHKNTMLMKLVRNLSHHAPNKPLFVEFVGDIAGAVTSNDAGEEFVIECIGTLSNILDFNTSIDIYAVVERYNLIPCIMNILDPDPELVLEGVVLAGALAGCARAALALARAAAPDALVAALRARQADDDHVLQTVKPRRISLILCKIRTLRFERCATRAWILYHKCRTTGRQGSSQTVTVQSTLILQLATESCPTRRICIATIRTDYSALSIYMPRIYPTYSDSCIGAFVYSQTVTVQSTLILQLATESCPTRRICIATIRTDYSALSIYMRPAYTPLTQTAASEQSTADNRTEELYGTTDLLTEKATENDAIYTNDLKKWDSDDYRMVRFTNAPKQVNHSWAANLIASVPPKQVTKRVVWCDGGSGPEGHPRVYINLDKPGDHSCGYCGLRFEKTNNH
ncbi:hypothetical protein MSG28_002188 [Choristoneura fumiferana]|uniref:Uncharacterized protein n=1 Tax=Choristoneura fumiferana TaxID=7141 RepID=A0ACC0JUX2_CHOFU|nr:hypothetical protein MSG28_002188 [Choristoneura fumiferana]